VRLVYWSLLAVVTGLGSQVGPDWTGPVPSTTPELPELDHQFVNAVALGDFALAKRLDRQLSRCQTSVTGPVSRVSVRHGPCGAGSLCWGEDIAIDTNPVAALAATNDPQGIIWVAAAYPDSSIRIYTSTDQGLTWSAALQLDVAASISQIELLVGNWDSNFVFLFYLAPSGDGDLWEVRLSPDLSSWNVIPVAVGPDTIDDFSVTIDTDSAYYLYCLFVNERRTGRTGRFTRSLDYGRSWEAGQDWWNAYDPNISFGTGSTIHCVWRYALTGRQIHYESSHYYGAPGHWERHHVMNNSPERCWDPVVVQSDTLPQSSSVVLVFYTVGRRDSAMLDLTYSYSGDGGTSWTIGQTFSDSFADEWFPCLALDRTNPHGFVDLSYTYGGTRPDDATVVYWRCARFATVGTWSEPIQVNGPRANPFYESGRPRLVYSGTHTPRGPGVIFSRYGRTQPNGIYFDATWQRPLKPARESPLVLKSPSVLRNRRAPVLGHNSALPNSVSVYDVTGRIVAHCSTVAWDGRDKQGRLVPPGTYLVRITGPAGTGTVRLVINR